MYGRAPSFENFMIMTSQNPANTRVFMAYPEFDSLKAHFGSSILADCELLGWGFYFVVWTVPGHLF